MICRTTTSWWYGSKANCHRFFLGVMCMSPRRRKKIDSEKRKRIERIRRIEKRKSTVNQAKGKFGGGKKVENNLRKKRKQKTKRDGTSIASLTDLYLKGISPSNNPHSNLKSRTLTDRLPRKCYGIHPHCSICGQCHTNRLTHDRGHPRR